MQHVVQASVVDSTQFRDAVVDIVRSKTEAYTTVSQQELWLGALPF